MKLDLDKLLRAERDEAQLQQALRELDKAEEQLREAEEQLRLADALANAADELPHTGASQSALRDALTAYRQSRR